MSTESPSEFNTVPASQTSNGPSVTLAMVFQWAAAVGVATGLIEAIVWAYRRHVLGRMIYQGMHYFWLAPLTDLVIFSGVGAVVAVALKIVPRRFRPRLVAFAFVFLSVMGLRGIAPRVHSVAWILLSVGAATAISEFLQLKTDAAKRRLRYAAVAGLVLCAALTASGLLYERQVEHQALVNLPEAPAGSPNLLWIVLDTVPAKRMSLYGHPRATTPRLEQFAKTGVRFNRCFSPSPWTLPAHGSMFTGFMPHDQTSGWTVPLDDTHPTIGEVLQRQGYATAGFGANTYYLSAEFGLGRGFGRFREPRKLLMQALQSSQLADSIAKRTILPIWRGRIVGEKTAADINGECLTWLDRRSPDRPYFAFLNYIDTHGPYLPPPEFARKFGSPQLRNPFPNSQVLKRPNGQTQLQQLTQAYEACLAYVDDQVGRLLDELRARGLLDNTVVIIVADHGEQLGENNLMGHANSLYLPLLHVPLIVSSPDRLPTNQQVDRLVSLSDLPATVCELLSLPQPSPFPGSSLVGLMTKSAADANRSVCIAEVIPKPSDRLERGDELAPIARGEMRSAFSLQYHYVLNGDGSEELYHYVDDPDETRNLINDVDAAEQLESLRAAVKY